MYLTSIMRFLNILLKSSLICMVRLYQILLSPWLGRNCIYTPTCSAYAIEAINKHGAIKGIFLSVKRVLKCNPYNDGGVDEVPK